MKKISTFFFLCFCFTPAQNFDPNTGELVGEQFDPNTGKKIEEEKDTLTVSDINVPSLTKNNIMLSQFDSLDFEDIYNNETIYPAPPWYGNSISSKYFKAKKGSYFLNNRDIENELMKFSQSEDLLKDHKRWGRISFSMMATTIMVPIIFSSVEVGILHIASFYGGVALTIYSINQFKNKWHEAIWVYNRENIKAQLYLDKK